MKTIGNGILVYYNGTSYIVEDPSTKDFISIQMLVKDNKEIFSFLYSGNLKDGTPEEQVKREIEKSKNKDTKNL